MELFEHTERWVKGESFEAGMLLGFGLGVAALAFYFRLAGHGAASRALFVPFLVVGLLWAGAGGIGLVWNAHRLETFRIEHQKDPGAFVASERARVEGFLGYYRPLLIGWTVLVLVGLGLFHLWGGQLGRAVGIATILFAVGGLMVDHTSEHNARAYHAEVVKAPPW